MNLDKIRGMSDYELRKFISGVASARLCAKCGDIISSFERYNINISIYQPHEGQKARKLCGLCEKCYIDMLDFLGVSDIEW